jgi:hypothetical protein
MALIIQDLPYSEIDREVDVPDGKRLLVRRHQIVVSVSIADTSQTTLNVSTPAFPALLDTGFNHNFMIQSRHLVRWARIRPRSLICLGTQSVVGATTRRYEANLWLHRHPPDVHSGQGISDPFPLPLNDGVIVSPPFIRAHDGRLLRYTYPRIPLLGMRALRESDLHVLIDAENLRVSIRAP